MATCLVENNLPIPIGVGETNFHVGASKKMVLQEGEIEGLRKIGLSVQVLPTEEHKLVIEKMGGDTAPRPPKQTLIPVPVPAAAPLPPGLSEVIFVEMQLEFGKIDAGKSVTIRVPIPLLNKPRAVVHANPTVELPSGIVYSTGLHENMYAAVTLLKLTPGSVTIEKSTWNIMVFVSEAS